MPRVKKTESRLKKQKVIASEAKQSTRSNKIATSPSAPRNDKSRSASLSIPVYSLAGRSAGTLALPKEIFGKEVNKKLLSQAVRVYLTNQKSLPGKTKTRGEVEGSSVKIYRQKGTGRARHGSIRAPIFVGGGIVFGPTPRKVRLALPKKMKKAALFAALSAKALDKNIVGVSGIDKASGKTKEIAKLVNSLWPIVNGKDKKTINILIVTGQNSDNIVRAARNISGVNVVSANLVNAYEVLKHQMLFITKEAIDKIGRKENNETKDSSEQSGSVTKSAKGARTGLSK